MAKLNANVVSEQELKLIPGIGDVISSRFIEARERLGGFESTEQISEEVVGLTTKDTERVFYVPEPEVEEPAQRRLDPTKMDFSPVETDEEEEEDRDGTKRWLIPALIVGGLLLAGNLFFGGLLIGKNQRVQPQPEKVVETSVPTEVAQEQNAPEETEEVSQPTAVPTEESEPVQVEEPSYEVPEGAVLLGANDSPIGHVIFPNQNGSPDVDVAVDEAGITLVAFGEGQVNGYAVKPTAEDIGHIVVIRGKASDGTTPKDLNNTVTLSDYVAGHVAVTQIYKIWSEDGEQLHMEDAVSNMLHEAPNCGADSCNTVYLWELQEDGLNLLEKRTQ